MLQVCAAVGQVGVRIYTINSLVSLLLLSYVRVMVIFIEQKLLLKHLC